MDRVFVTGASGFVGSAVARALAAEGNRVCALVRRTSRRDNLDLPNLEVIEGDMRDATAVARGAAGARYVFHVAADYRLWAPDPAEIIRNNTAGTRAVLRAALDAKVERIVYTSSVATLAPGAGGTPTASAVIGDIISIVNTAPGGFLQNCVCYKQLGFFPSDEVVSRFYVRLHVVDRPGVLAQLAKVFGDEGVSIQSMQQTGGGETAQLVLVLHPVREASFFAALKRIGALPVVSGTPSVIRVEGDYAG